jgi:cell division septum initiation protein DivIVA
VLLQTNNTELAEEREQLREQLQKQVSSKQSSQMDRTVHSACLARLQTFPDPQKDQFMTISELF